MRSAPIASSLQIIVNTAWGRGNIAKCEHLDSI
jgi:hypothetical protein